MAQPASSGDGGSPKRGIPLLPPRARKGFAPGDGKKQATVAIAAAVPAIAAAAWAWAVKKASGPPKLWVGDGALKHRVLPWCTALTSPFVPAPLALNTHAQNVLGFIRGATIHPNYTRQLIIAQDGGTLGLDWFNACDSPKYAAPDTPVLLVLHGINGGSHEGYCKWVCAEACKRGWRATVLNYRGCGGLPLTSPRGYAASLTHDIHFAITSIKARFPTAPVFAVGYSLGGVFLTKYLAEADNGLHTSVVAAKQPGRPHPAPPPSPQAMPASAPAAAGMVESTIAATPTATASATATTAGAGGAARGQRGEGSEHEPWVQRGSGLVAAAVVSSPICLFNSSAQLSQPFSVNYLYNLALAFKLREFIREHEKEIRANTRFDMEAVLSQWTVPAMEDKGIPQTFGFKNRMEYYEAVSSLGYIPHIKTATLFLLAQDDPFLGVLPDQECANNPNTLLAATERGGHVAFLQGLWPFGPAYMDVAVLQFLDAVWKHLPPPSPSLDRPLPTSPSTSPVVPPSLPTATPLDTAGSLQGGGAFRTRHSVDAASAALTEDAARGTREQGAGEDGAVGEEGAEVSASGRVWLQPEVLQLSSSPLVTTVADVTSPEQDMSPGQEGSTADGDGAAPAASASAPAAGASEAWRQAGDVSPDVASGGAHTSLSPPGGEDEGACGSDGVSGQGCLAGLQGQVEADVAASLHVTTAAAGSEEVVAEAESGSPAAHSHHHRALLAADVRPGQEQQAQVARQSTHALQRHAATPIRSKL